MLCLSGTTVFGISIKWKHWVHNANGKGRANIRKIAELSPTEHSVLQGSCSDGKGNFYFVFMKKSDETIKLVKMKYEKKKFTRDWIVPINGYYKGNDMTYVPDAGDISGNDKILIANQDPGEHYDKRTNYIAVFDVASKRVEGSIVSRYWNELNNCKLYYHGHLVKADDSANAPRNAEGKIPCLKDYVNSSRQYGFSTLAYNKKRGKLVVGLINIQNLMIFNLEYRNGRFVMTPESYLVQEKKKAALQGMDCDSKNIYMTWSAGHNYSGNRLCIYNWIGARKKACILDYSYEVEGISHVGSTLYAAYHHSYNYYWYTEEEKEVPWKKVRSEDQAEPEWIYKKVKYKKKHREFRRNAYVKVIKL